MFNMLPHWTEEDAIFWLKESQRLLHTPDASLFKGKGVFLVPPRCIEDVGRNFPDLFSRMSSQEAEKFLWGLGPLIGPPIYVNGRWVGLTMFAPRTPNMIKADPDGSLALVQQCAQFARNLGAEWLATGAFLGSFVALGRYLHVPGLKITLGHSTTVYLAVEIFLKGLRQIGVNPQLATVAVAGAGGNIGRSISLQLAGKVRKIILFDQVGGAIHRRMEQVAQVIRQHGTAVSAHSNGEGYFVLKEADGVVTAVTAEDQPLKEEHLSKNVLVAEDSQPMAMSDAEAAKLKNPRLDVVAYTPGVDTFFDFQPGIGRNGVVYACLAELLVCLLTDASEGLIGMVTSESVAKAAGMLSQIGYNGVILHSDQGIISDEAWLKPTVPSESILCPV